MMQQGGQGSEGRHPSSPRGSGGNSMSKFSLLGQQLTSYGSASQHHQNHQSAVSPTNMGFSLGIHSQPFAQGHGQPQSQTAGSGGVNDNGGGFANLQNVNSLGSVQGFNGNHQLFIGNQLQPGGDLLKGSLPVNMQNSSPEAIMNALSVIQQKIGQLQAIVPLLAQGAGGPVSTPLVQQQTAAAAGAVNMISQLAAVAAGMFPPNQVPQQNMSVPSQSISDAQLGQLFGQSNAQGFNFFQQNGSQSMNNSVGNAMGTSFNGLQGGSVGNNMAMGNSGNLSVSGAAGIPNLAASPPNQSSGLGAPGGSSGLSCQSFGGSGGEIGGGVANSAGLGIRKKHGGVFNNQMSSAITRGGAIGNNPQMSSESALLNRPPLNPGPITASPVEDHDSTGRAGRDEDDDGDGENLPPGSYELVEMDAMEILAEHTHFCEICGKGFKRDANLRMHMRGHGDEYKTPAALARPDKASHEMSMIRPRRYSCPYVGCKRNKKHRKFQPLKTMLCVKNHYRRSHCPKMLTCNKCKTKKFSVMADLKTHEKHCGCDKWQCSCGTTFSRKDKLIGHIGLFAGHTAAMPLNDTESPGGLDASEIGSSNASGMGLSGTNSGFAPSNGLGLNPGTAVGMGLGGLQGLGGRAAGSLSLAEDGSVGSDNGASANTFNQSGGNLSPGSSMLQGLFTSNFLQGSNGGSNSSDGLH